MTTPDAGATNGVPDLNDPAQRFSRETGMAAMLARRREIVANEMRESGDNEMADLVGKSPPGIEGAPAAGAVADPDAEDTSAADAAAEAERKRLEAESQRQEEARAARAQDDNPELDPTKQSQAQVDFVDLTEDDLKHVRVPITINGETKIVTGEELRRMGQKVGAADDYLEQTRTMLHEVKALRAGTSVAPAATPAPTADNAAKPAATDEERAAAADAVVDLMYQGDLDGAKEKLRTLLAMPSAKPVDVDAAVDAALKQRVIKDGLRQFRENHKELVADPVARRLADDFLYQDLAQRGVTRLEDLPTDQIATVLDGAGRAAEEWISRVSGGGSLAGGAGGGTATSLRDRLNRKKQSDELPTASLRSDTSVPAVKSVTDKLNEMRKARGQPVA